MKNLFLYSLIAFLLLVSLVSANVNQVNTMYYGTIDDNGNLITTNEPVTNFNVIGFVCNDAHCNSIDSTLWGGAVINSGSNNFVDLIYPQVLQKAGYGLYFYKEGFITYEVNATWAGEGTATPKNRYLTQAENCEVPIEYLIVSHTGNKVRVNLTLDAGVSSPLQHAGPLNHVPDSISHLYAVDAKVDFRFIGPENVSITKTVNLPFSETRDVFAETTLAAGQYVIEVESNTVDDKCLHSVSNIKKNSIFIADNRTNATLPLVEIVSPEAKTYTNKTIILQIDSKNATSTYYNINNGANVTYIGITPLTLNDGSYMINAFASNAIATAFDSVTFQVDTSSNNNTNNSLPVLQIISPEHKGYTTKAILVNLSAINASNVWFNWKGHNYTYVSPTLFTFDEGFNNFTAFASNSKGVVSKNVNFYINTSLVCYNTLPFIRIESPYSLTYTSKSQLLNITAINASNVWYSLNAGSDVTYTQSHNIISNEGQNTVTAYASNPCGTSQDSVTFTVKLNNDNNNNNHDGGGKKAKGFPPMDEVANETLTPIYLEEDVSPITIAPKKAQSYDLLTIMLVILSLGVIVLIILLILVSLRK